MTKKAHATSRIRSRGTCFETQVFVCYEVCGGRICMGKPRRDIIFPSVHCNAAGLKGHLFLLRLALTMWLGLFHIHKLMQRFSQCSTTEYSFTSLQVTSLVESCLHGLRTTESIIVAFIEKVPEVSGILSWKNAFQLSEITMTSKPPFASSWWPIIWSQVMVNKLFDSELDKQFRIRHGKLFCLVFLYC